MSTKSPIEQIRSRELPRMVSWYDPRLLARIGVRTMISSVFGQYADQRLLQAATDQATVPELLQRYDFSDPYSNDPARRLTLDEGGAVWVDYIADTGDGFESTYTLAYLLAQDKVTVEGAGELRHGEILIMGGDQCYPQATREEYKRRLLTPFNWAFDIPLPKRKLFAIPGNHDWYDGLAAFDSLFCTARDKLSSGHGGRIGGWQCPQHRSYWALKLPHRWWVWGTDIQFSSYLDAAQVNYFETIAAQMGPDDNLIICMAEPAWMLADLQGQDEEQNFFKITAIARERGVRIRAVIAGDWHHYNRYYAPELDVHFVTAGGGGSFLHPTHVLKNEISVAWPQRASWGETAQEPIDMPAQGDWTAHRYGMRLRRGDAPIGPIREAVRNTVRDALSRASPSSATAAQRRSTKCYPDKSRSWWLSLKNLAFPIYNLPFAIGIGIVYWLVSWNFDTVVRQYNISDGQIQTVVFTEIAGLLPLMPLFVLQATISPSFVVMIAGLYFVLVNYVQATERPGARRFLVKFGVGTTHFLVHSFAIFSLLLVFRATNNQLAPVALKGVEYVWNWAETREAGISKRIIEESLKPLAQKSDQQVMLDEEQKRLRQAIEGQIQSSPADPMTPLGPLTRTPTSFSGKLVRDIVGFLYPIQMILIGGLIGGFIWGLYWVLCGLLGRMHAEDAFAALRIKDYKHFLRFKVEPERLTIYPIGIDRVLRERDLESPRPDSPPATHNPALVPKSGQVPLRLIEEPIVIVADHLGPR